MMVSKKGKEEKRAFGRNKGNVANCLFAEDVVSDVNKVVSNLSGLDAYLEIVESTLDYFTANMKSMIADLKGNILNDIFELNLVIDEAEEVDCDGCLYSEADEDSTEDEEEMLDEDAWSLALAKELITKVKKVIEKIDFLNYEKV